LRKATKASFNITDVREENWTRDVPNAKQEWTLMIIKIVMMVVVVLV
jgi:hypothetical protein